jgi:hypothetical protein
MTRVSIITHENTVNVLVREGTYCVELAGERPWPLLFKAVTILKYREAAGYINDKLQQLAGAIQGIKHFVRTISRREHEEIN